MTMKNKVGKCLLQPDHCLPSTTAEIFQHLPPFLSRKTLQVLTLMLMQKGTFISVQKCHDNVF
jgi:hypothetical protein